jgi:hypothetical protein
MSADYLSIGWLCLTHITGRRCWWWLPSCTTQLNVAAVAAKKLRDTYQRVAVLDVDYHAGNGTSMAKAHSP